MNILWKSIHAVTVLLHTCEGSLLKFMT